jgi:putative transcriptional regulator
MSKLDDSILAAMHETASGLHRAGLIDKRRMAHYDALCLPPSPDYGASQIKALRRRLNLSQTVLADVLGASPSTVRKWEAGDKRPSGPSRRLLDILDRKGLEAVL